MFRSILLVLIFVILLALPKVFAQMPQINAGGIVNAASFGQVISADRTLAPGVIFSIFGTSLTDGTTAAATSTPLPSRLAGARVLVNGAPAPLFFASPLQINAQFPVDVTGLASVQVEVQTASGTVTSEPASVAVGSASPGIFTWDQNGQGPGAILRNSDFSKICPNGRTDCPPNLAGLGEVIAIYMTGLGAVDGPWASGQVAEGSSPTLETPIVTIGGREAPVLFSGLAAGFVGLYQVNVAVPRGISLTDSVTLQVGIGKERFVFCPVGSSDCQILADPYAAAGIGEDWQIFCPPGSASRSSRCSALPPGEIDLSKAQLLPQGFSFKPPTGNTVTIATANFPRLIEAGGGPTGGSITSIAVDPANSSTVYAGTDGGGIFKSSDGGQSWAAANSGLTDPDLNVVAIAPSSPETLYVGTDGSGVFKSTDGGQTWSAINTGVTYRDIRALAVHPANSNIIYAGGTFLFKSINGGESWQTVNCDLPPLRCSSIRSLAIAPTNPETVYVGAASFGILRSTDGGQTWTDVGRSSLTGIGGFPTGLSMGSSTTGSIHALVIDPANPATVYAASDGGVLKTTNGGQSWTVITCFGRAFGNGFCDPATLSLALAPSNPATLYMGTSFLGVYKTTNGGGSWTAVNSGIQEVHAQPQPYQPFRGLCRIGDRHRCFQDHQRRR